MVYLALRKRPKANKFLDWLVHLGIMYKTISKYSHGGIYCNGYLYEVTSKNNMTKTVMKDNSDWDFFYAKHVSEELLNRYYEQYKDYKYDWFSLLRFFNLDARDSKKLYCFEWCFIVLTGEDPQTQITPEILIRLTS